MDLREAVALSLWKGVGRRELGRLLGLMQPDEVLSRLRRAMPGGGPDEAEVERRLRLADLSGTLLLLPGSPGYPELLLGVPDPPLFLFCRGDAEAALSRPAVAVIGSRRCTAYGRRVARRLSRDLASAGVTVVSGLARGIDGEAHRGSLDGGGPTVAVLGCGPDVAYPPEHARLMERVAGCGALLSEYPPGSEPTRHAFPERNRIVSGVSLGVVVVEAGARSGTMITVNTALDQGREVMAVPGEITGALSVGTNRLLRDGACLVASARDVLEPLGLETAVGSVPAAASGELTETQRMLLSELERGPMHFDSLLHRTGLEPTALRSALLELEMAGRMVAGPGRIYSLV